jgi:hypothetical protein
MIVFSNLIIKLRRDSEFEATLSEFLDDHGMMIISHSKWWDNCAVEAEQHLIRVRCAR